MRCSRLAAVALAMGCGVVTGAMAQGLGAAPQTYWEDLAVRSAMSGKPACAMVGAYAANLVAQRYAGVAMSDAMSGAFWPTEKQLVKDAYSMPRMVSAQYRAGQAATLREQAEIACYQVMGTGD